MLVRALVGHVDVVLADDPGQLILVPEAGLDAVAPGELLEGGIDERLRIGDGPGVVDPGEPSSEVGPK
jgi:hypothetical protein